MNTTPEKPSLPPEIAAMFEPATVMVLLRRVLEARRARATATFEGRVGWSLYLEEEERRWRGVSENMHRLTFDVERLLKSLAEKEYDQADVQLSINVK